MKLQLVIKSWQLQFSHFLRKEFAVGIFKIIFAAFEDCFKT